MGVRSRSRDVWTYLLSFGEHDGESDAQREKRRIIIATVWIALVLTIPTAAISFREGQTWVAVGDTARVAAGFAGLVAIRFRPLRFALIVNGIFFVVFLSQVSETVLLGGLAPSGFVVMFGLIVVLGALVALSLRAAFFWFVAFVGSVIFSIFVPDWVDPVYVVEDAISDAAFNLILVTMMAFAVMAYFVRQRNFFQKRSDDLLHNILPDEVASRLKNDGAMIADDYPTVSVLFADVVDFTPMSAGMPAAEVVGLLNEVFTAFDGFVDELGLEKIKTVGDAYMVAGGVPIERPDHAHAVADLALRMRDHVATADFAGRRIALRLGINSGPVVAGIIGTRKFIYDLWGDTVNTASRMESTSLPGFVQVSRDTYELIRDRFVCEERGVVSVKGKGNMETYFLISLRPDAGTPGETAMEPAAP